jgi:hypothetical protein
MIDPSTRITRYTESMRGLVNQAGSVVLQANDQIDDGTFDHARCAKAAKQLANLALTAGLDVVPQLLSIPFGLVAGDQLNLSDFIEVDPDNDCQRSFSMSQSLVQDGAPSNVIPDHLIVFVPGTLRVYAKRFRVGIRSSNLPSGTYTGQVRLTRLNPPTPSADAFVEVIIDL